MSVVEAIDSEIVELGRDCCRTLTLLVSVSIIESGYSPATITVPEGEDVTWHNRGTRQHTSTQDDPLALWDTDRVAVGGTSASVTFFAAGGYPYHCSIHANMHGTIIVPIVVSPLRGTKKTTFTLRLASASQAGFTYDVQKRFIRGTLLRDARCVLIRPGNSRPSLPALKKSCGALATLAHASGRAAGRAFGLDSVALQAIPPERGRSCGP